MGCGSSTCMSSTQTEIDIRGKGNLLSTQEFLMRGQQNASKTKPFVFVKE